MCVQASLDVVPELNFQEAAVDFCTLAVQDTAVQESTFEATYPLSTVFRTSSSSVDNSAFYTWQEQCELNLRDFLQTIANQTSVASGTNAAEDDQAVLQSLGGGSGSISLSRTLAFTTTQKRGLQRRGRQLMRRGGGGRGGGSAAKGRAFQSQTAGANVGEQRWNTSDVAFRSATVNLTVLPERTIGDNNVLVGGLLMHQVLHSIILSTLWLQYHCVSAFS